MERDGRARGDGTRSDRPRARGGAAATEARGPAERFACPFCGSEDTERIGLWGATLLASQYWCRACRTGFDVVRWRPRPADAGPGGGGVAEEGGAVAGTGRPRSTPQG